MKVKPFAKNYRPGEMSFAEGFLGPKWDIGYQMRVDYGKAKRIIRSLLEEGRKIERAELGLDGDFRICSEVVYDEEGFHAYDNFPGSIWAEPVLIVYYEDGPCEAYKCWKKKERGKRKSK